MRIMTNCLGIIRFGIKNTAFYLHFPSSISVSLNEYVVNSKEKFIYVRKQTIFISGWTVLFQCIVQKVIDFEMNYTSI